MNLEGQWISYPIKDQADLTWALVKTTESVLFKGTSTLDQSLIKTIMSELGTNIIKYAKRGVLSVKRTESKGSVDIYIEAVDNGPGIADIGLAMQDRYTTGTSLGLGLPSVRRLADTFSIVSEPVQGTRITASKRIRGSFSRQTPMDQLSSLIDTRLTPSVPVQTLRSATFEVACYARPVPTELVSGDIADIYETHGGILLALVDVSGHGDKAGNLARQIRQYLSSCDVSNTHLLMAGLHEKLIGTQGASVALIFVDIQRGHADFCAVGNAGAARVIGAPWKPISKDGVLGQRLPTLKPQRVKLNNGDLILMWTDGLSELAAKRFAAENARQPAAKLAVDLVNALGRPFDDASCIVFKWIA